MHAHHGGDGAVAGGDLLQQQCVGHRVDLRAIPLRGRGGAEDAEFAEFSDDLRLDGTGLFARGGAGDEALGGEPAGHIDDEGVGADWGMIGHGWPPCGGQDTKVGCWSRMVGSGAVVPDVDVVVIGAGLAGLGAATALREAGRAAVVLEASARIGGRALTTYPAELGGVWWDVGAVWLHNAETNPLVPIARAAGDALLRSDELRVERTFVGTREATAEEYADYAGAWQRFEDRAADILRTRDDVPLAEVARSMPDDRWAVTVETWEGPIICVADADEFSARDWLRNVLSGSNLVPAGGIGAFVARRLGEGLDIRLSTPVTRIAWDGDGVAVETARGTITARSAIVTVSTGVLGAGAIVFDPPLPDATQAAIDAIADGAGDEGCVARHGAGSAGPAAALLGRSAGAA